MFKPVSDAKISRAIVRDFSRWLEEYISCDVIIVGGGPSGLLAARELANKKFKTLVIEANNYLGGGFWMGGFLMNTLTFRSPSETVLDELNIPYKEAEEGLYITDGPTACSKLISAACDAGVKFLNMTKFDDVVYQNNKVTGVVINWTPISYLPRQVACVDPISLEAKVVIDSTGHDACVCRSLEKRGYLKLANFGPMNATASEDLVVEKTGQIFPGLIITGMAVSTAYGIPRMGPTFGSMLLSGKKGAEEAVKMIEQQKKNSELEEKFAA
ncbi:MAG: sulfide-dependent adenosine diphosphate thiazole synthase [Candidatus Omnitrophota bacterium]